ncbi:unannotated protein [freshwater metagenome]|uniref:Unannotated protein n=1 Tax=freshwater metagenome TaxID=449393 RepID=A0A6J7F3V8_9ZZZZ|nr:hypothetical protein [Actinomycetota bacterium]
MANAGRSGSANPANATSGGASAAGAAGSTTTRTAQTITSVIAVGSSVGPGDVIYTVDNLSVIALSGALPAWRTLSTASTNGADIQQLESGLVALGYDPDGTVTVDQHFDAKTAAMVKAWQTGRGETATGSVALGSVVFVPSATTVLEVTAKVGDQVGDGSKILVLAADSQQVVIDVPNGHEANVVPGLSVAIGSGAGTVTLLRSTVRSGAVVVQALITPTAPIQGVANGASVPVTISFNTLQGVLIAPSQALLSRLDGSYAVQIQAADGTVTWHTVELLGVSGGKVGIRGDGIAAGALVLVPA